MALFSQLNSQIVNTLSFSTLAFLLYFSISLTNTIITTTTTITL